MFHGVIPNNTRRKTTTIIWHAGSLLLTPAHSLTASRRLRHSPPCAPPLPAPANLSLSGRLRAFSKAQDETETAFITYSNYGSVWGRLWLESQSFGMLYHSRSLPNFGSNHSHLTRSTTLAHSHALAPSVSGKQSFRVACGSYSDGAPIIPAL